MLAFIAPPVHLYSRFFFGVIAISRRPITELDYVRLINLSIEGGETEAGRHNRRINEYSNEYRSIPRCPDIKIDLRYTRKSVARRIERRREGEEEEKKSFNWPRDVLNNSVRIDSG